MREMSLPHFHGQEKTVYTSHERGKQWKKKNESLRLSAKEKRSGWWKAAENPLAQVARDLGMA